MVDYSRIQKIIRDCLTDDQNEETSKYIHGLAYQVRVDRNKLESYKDEIVSILDEIIPEDEPVIFYRLSNDKYGNTWGTPFQTELLLMLCFGLDLMTITSPPKNVNTKDLHVPFLIRKKKEKELVLKRIN